MEINDTAEFLHYVDRVRARTLRVLRRVPEDEWEWRPAEGAFSFGDLVRHLAAIERWTFAENACRRPSRYPGHGPEVAAGHESAVAYLEAMHAETRAMLEALTPDDLRARCVTPGGTEIPVWKWLRSMVEHEIHHRGQIYLMLRMLGVSTPPMYGLTSEEVRARSVPDPVPNPDRAERSKS